MSKKSSKRTFLGTRLNPEKDSDIIQDVSRFKDVSKRLREAYRLAMQVEAGDMYVKKEPAPDTSKLKWSIPEPVKKKAKNTNGQTKVNIISNIKQSF